MPSRSCATQGLVPRWSHHSVKQLAGKEYDASAIPSVGLDRFEMRNFLTEHFEFRNLLARSVKSMGTVDFVAKWRPGPEGSERGMFQISCWEVENCDLLPIRDAARTAYSLFMQRIMCRLPTAGSPYVLLSLSWIRSVSEEGPLNTGSDQGVRYDRKQIEQPTATTI